MLCFSINKNMKLKGIHFYVIFNFKNYKQKQLANLANKRKVIMTGLHYISIK